MPVALLTGVAVVELCPGILVAGEKEVLDPATDADLEEFCKSRLSGYKVPRLLVRVADMRRSPSGKPDYPWAKELVTRAAEDLRTQRLLLDQDVARYIQSAEDSPIGR